MRTTLAIALLLAALPVTADELVIGIIDLYGLHRVSAAQVRGALAFKVGDKFEFGVDAAPLSLMESGERLSALPGLVGVDMSPICCDAGRLIVYVGVQEAGAPNLRLRPAPTGDARLAADVVQAGAEFTAEHMAAVQRGDAMEDDSQGHALSRAPAVRAAQERFLVYAARDLANLRTVLRESSVPEQRALAAQVLGYTADKPAVVDDLVYAMSDPDRSVRNNAMRALMVFARKSPDSAGPMPRVPAEPFIALLSSLAWTDLNKASLALNTLTMARDPALLAQLRREALGPLTEMARWQSAGHAHSAYMIVARIAGVTDEAATAAWERGERETIIKAALHGQ